MGGCVTGVCVSLSFFLTSKREINDTGGVCVKRDVT